jgi:hypothetical protein
MGYLNNSSVTVDAILTKKGRELLARGRSEFQITQFALADDEVDYNLWNPAHPLGSEYYGIIIENMPLVEASTDESAIMKYKLISLPKSTTRIPVISVTPTAVTLLAPGQSTVLSPTTVNFVNGNSNLGYTAILSDSSVCTLEVVDAAPSGLAPSIPRFIGDSEASQSVSVTGRTFRIAAKTHMDSDKTATITIIGNETGGRQVVNVTVRKVQPETVVR